MGMNNWGGITEHMFLKNRRSFQKRKELRFYKIKKDEILEHKISHHRALKTTSKKLKRILRFLVSIFSILLISLIHLSIKPMHVITESSAQIDVEKQKENRKHLNLYMKYKKELKRAERNFEAGKIQGAIYRYQRAKDIYPYQIEPRVGLIQSYQYLCKTSGTSCDKISIEIENAHKHLSFLIRIKLLNEIADL